MASLSFVGVGRLIDLLRSADPKSEMQVRVISTNRLAVGVDPLRPISVIDLSRESVYPFDSESSATKDLASQEAKELPMRVQPVSQPVSRGARQGGSCWMEFNGKRIEFKSQKELLSNALIMLEDFKRGTLESLSTVKPRSRRIVARDRRLLFDNPKLIEEHSDRLIGDWWYNTNNSWQQVSAWLERGCSCAGLKWEKDVRIGFA